MLIKCLITPACCAVFTQSSLWVWTLPEVGSCSEMLLRTSWISNRGVSWLSEVKRGPPRGFMKAQFLRLCFYWFLPIFVKKKNKRYENNWTPPSPFVKLVHNFYRTRVRSLAMLINDSLTHSLTHGLLFSKLDGLEWYWWYWYCLMMSQQLLEVFLQRKKTLQNGENTSESKVLTCWSDAF